MRSVVARRSFLNVVLNTHHTHVIMNLTLTPNIQTTSPNNPLSAIVLSAMSAWSYPMPFMFDPICLIQCIASPTEPVLTLTCNQIPTQIVTKL